MQELPGHADQAGVPQLAVARYLQECEGPGAGPAREPLYCQLHADIWLCLLLSDSCVCVCVCARAHVFRMLRLSLRSSPLGYRLS